MTQVQLFNKIEKLIAEYHEETQKWAQSDNGYDVEKRKRDFAARMHRKLVKYGYSLRND